MTAPAPGPGALPTVIIIGAQKCGTTALHSYLAVHPAVSASSPKELDFFIAERNWAQGLDWYRSHFDPSRPVRVESSPNYTTHPIWKGVPQRMAKVVPEARLIYMVRDPLDLIASHWVHRRQSRAPAQALRSRRSTYFQRSRYMYQLERFLKCFPAERILVLEQDDLRHRRIETLERVFAFAGIDTSFRHPTFGAEVPPAGEQGPFGASGAAIHRWIRRSPLRRFVPKGVLSRSGLLEDRSIERPDVRGALPDASLEVLREDARRFRAHTGLALEQWSV